MKSHISTLFVVALLLAGFYSHPQAQASCSSSGTNAVVDIRVPNLTDQTLNVYWKDFGCVEQLIAPLSPGGVFYQTTSDGHEWIFRDPTGAVVDSFVAQASQPNHVVGKVPFNPEPITPKCSNLATTTPMDLTIINNTDDPVLLSWIDFSCAEILYEVIKGKDQLVQPTMVEHEWVVRYQDGKIAEQLTATPTNNTVIINPPPTPANPTTQTSPTAIPQQSPTTATSIPQTNSTASSGGPVDVLLLELWLNNQSEIWRIQPNGASLMSLNQVGNAGRFATDGSRIVFYSDRDGDEEIFIMDADGSNLQQLTNNTDSDVYPGFTPDGLHIVFSSIRDGNYEIYMMDVDGSNVQRITNRNEDDRGARVSPDGTRIVFHSGVAGSNDIYIMSIDGTNIKPLTSASGNNTFPRFSPDGSRIIFHSNRDGNYNIYVMNADGTNPQGLTSDPLDEAHPFFSPDSSQIVFNQYLPDNSTKIYMMNADGTNLHFVIDGFAMDWFQGVLGQSTQASAAPTNTAPANPSTTISSQFTGPAVEFIWNTDSFYIYNPGDTFDIVPIRFEEVDSNGQPTGVFFEGFRWASIYDKLQRNYCNEIEISTGTNYLNPAVCQGVNARVSPSPSDPVIFWHNASIRVLWNGTEIGRCATIAGSCTLNLP